MAGAVAGVAVGLLTLGTVTYVLAGVDIGGLQESIKASSLAEPIAHASLVSTSSPWCSRLSQAASSLAGGVAGEAAAAEQASDSLEECTDLEDLASEKLTDLLGQNVGTLIQVVKGSLTGPSEDPTNLVQAQQ